MIQIYRKRHSRRNGYDRVTPHLAVTPQSIIFLYLPLELCLWRVWRKKEHYLLNIGDAQRSLKHFAFVASALLSYVLVDQVVLGHAGSEEFLLHLQYGCLLSAQPLLLGILNVDTEAEQKEFYFNSNKKNFKTMQAAGFYLDAL